MKGAKKKVRLDQTAEDRRRLVAHEVAIQRAWGPKLRRRKVLPRQIVPKRIAVEYATMLRYMFKVALEAYKPLIDAIRASTVRLDAERPKTKSKLNLAGRDAKRLLDDAERRLESTVSTTQVETLASKFAARTSTYQRMQLGRQVRAALGADPYVRDPVLAGVTEDFVAHNVSLIKRINRRLHEKIEGMVMNSVGKSQLSVNLGAEIQNQFGISERHARFVARDQLAKYYGAVNRARQREMGFTRFIWRTGNDERVRDSHADLNGEIFSWDDLPTNERGEEIYPGSDYQCRCSAEPVVDDLLDDINDAEDALGGDSFDFEETDEDEEQD